MHIYFSGIGGVGIGPLALIARDLGYEVSGSDLKNTRYVKLMEARGINIGVGQTRTHIAKIHAKKPIDWFVHTAALPKSHPEIRFAAEMKIKKSKRDEFINYVLRTKKLKLLAVSGTHGKTNTTAMLVWTLTQLGLPITYAIGTNISFGPSGKYEPGSNYCVYEADEFDRNMLAFHPYASVITALDFDHPDTYKDEQDYQQAFRQFAKQSESTFTWKSIAEQASLPAQGLMAVADDKDIGIKLVGHHTRRNATLAALMLEKVLTKDIRQIVEIINKFPGSERRLEHLRPNLISDYAHHPEEIKAVIQAALELSKNVVVVYQPHQNLRQHQIKEQYKDSFAGAKKVYWLSTYLSREPAEKVLSQAELIKTLDDPKIAEPAEMDQSLIDTITAHLEANDLVLVLGAGDVDEWARTSLADN